MTTEKLNTPGTQSMMRAPSTRRALSTLAILAAAIGGSACSGSGVATADRQRVVAAKGAEVMPFDLDATTHRFLPKPTGGVQQVLADDPADATQVELIRAHLRKERAKFWRGDFADPTAIHGADMPGVAELSAAGRNRSLAVTYADLPDGAQLSFTSNKPGVVAAVQRWLRAQQGDHGAHAVTS